MNNKTLLKILIPALLFLLLALASVWLKSHSTGQTNQTSPAQTQILESTASGAPAIGGPFTLIDDDNQPVSEQNLLGKFHIIFFGYTHCPDVCPTTLSTMADVYAALPAAQQQKLGVIFISVDPARDTPASLKQYVASFNTAFQGWTGTDAQLKTITKPYLAYYGKHPQPGDTPESYAMDHSSLLYLMNPQGAYATHFSATDSSATILYRLKPYLS